MPDATPPLRVLVADSLKRPHMLLWVVVLPQLLLLFLNARSYTLVSGELEPAQQRIAAAIGLAQLFLLALGATLVIVLRARRKPISWAWNWPLLVVHVAYLWMVTPWIMGHLLPGSVTVWILPPERLLYYQYALIMPAVFYAAVRLVCFPVRVRMGTDVGVTVALTVGVPAFWYVFFVVLSGLSSDLFSGLPEVVLMACLVGSTVITIAGMTRLLVLLYGWLSSKGEAGLAVLTFLVGVAAPVGGLLLNRLIPFPADFQSPWVYILAVANGLLLLVPVSVRGLAGRWVWLGRCVLFPFTVYFFVVFLPFLPLALPAILAIGSGFLILAPTALFVVHTRSLVDGYRRNGWPAAPASAVLTAAACMLVIPAYYTLSAAFDRHALHRAIEYAYQPDLVQSGDPDLPRGMVKRGLENLRDFKAGLQLPFLSEYYSWLVFNGLVLPDRKIQEVHRMFFGTDLEPVEADRLFQGLLGPRGRSRRAGGGPRRGTPPPRHVVLQDAQATVSREGAFETLSATLVMENPQKTQGEFVTHFELPDGVFVTGYWLAVGEERVPGRIFEKKTAMWVYQMIRDVTRRDPGLLLYQEKDRVELRVFPFAANETRKTGVELLYPAGALTALDIGDRSLPAGPPPGDERILVVPDADHGTYVYVPPAGAAALPSTTRKPYLHFVIDHSAGSTEDWPDILARCAQWAEGFAEVADCRVTLANFESFEVTDGLIPVGELGALETREWPECRGGFCRDRALKHLLSVYRHEMGSGVADPDRILRYPVPIIVTRSDRLPVEEEHLQWFAAPVPELNGYYVSTDAARLQVVDFSGRPVAGAQAAHTKLPVRMFAYGDEVVPVAADETGHGACFRAAENGAALRVFEPADRAFRPVENVMVVDPDTSYAAATRAWLANVALLVEPHRTGVLRREVLELSRTAGVLVPATSYIVVENDAQWKMLERKEAQKLGAKDALEFDEVIETPEPALWVLLLCFLAWAAWRRRCTTP